LYRRQDEVSEKKHIKTFCKSCHGTCGVIATVVDGVLRKLEGDPDSITEGKMCPKGLAAIQEVYNPNRLRYPLKRIGERGEANGRG
jgi:anaerobic selenocysteine-containing dehydrogenase